MGRGIFGWSLPPGVTTHMIDEAAGVFQQEEEEAFFEAVRSKMEENELRLVDAVISQASAETVDALNRQVFLAGSIGNDWGAQQHKANEAEYWALASVGELLRHLKSVRPDIEWQGKPLEASSD